MNSAGDNTQINFSGSPSKITYWVKKNGTSAAPYEFTVQESPDNVFWSDVAKFSDTGTQLPTTAVKYTNNLLSASRYLKLIYNIKASGINVGFDGIEIVGPGVPSVLFNPNGTTNAPVSNEFTMAVSISPSGSGMQSWNMTPSYSGAASLTGGTFIFTPATADQNKTFTVRVIATNSIGTTTGTATVVVTPYVAPVPVINFSPAAPYGIMATYTQKLGIGVSPAGSGISGWTLLPSNYAGSATLVGTNFTFTTAAADGPATYTFTVLATNVFGTSTGTAEIIVGEYVPPPPPGAYICTFEDGSKTGYASGDVTMSNKTWNLTGILIGTSADDLKIGSKSARLKFDPSDGEETMTVLEKVMGNGVGTVSFWYGPYGTHGEDAPVLAIEISENLASGWVEVGAANAGAVSVLTYYSAEVYVSTPIYVRIRAKSGNTGRSANFDDVMITPYAAPSYTPYEAFLLKYNVTPGDPGTAPAEDLDDDTHSNTNEFDADSNPYDPASVPP